MAKVRKQSRSEEIAMNIREKIFSGELVAGMRLIEQDIAKEFGMSRGPVREALQELEHEGLVVSEVNKGSTIASLSGEDAYEIFYLRGTLEKIALDKCGGKLLDSSILSMRNIIEDMRYEEEHEKRMPVLIAYDEQFHEEILLSGRMKRLHQLWKYLSPLNGSMFLKVIQYYKSLEEDAGRNPKWFIKKKKRKVWEMHQEILNVLEKGELEESLEIIEKHYFRTGEMLYRWEKRKEDYE
ncbi:MAG: GntR family transcriptional regulator [Eubacteriales bacterium]|nr:GntR family transcriptional regulator [Eubacteriales bacterium]